MYLLKFSKSCKIVKCEYCKCFNYAKNHLRWFEKYSAWAWVELGYVIKINDFHQIVNFQNKNRLCKNKTFNNLKIMSTAILPSDFLQKSVAKRSSTAGEPSNQSCRQNVLHFLQFFVWAIFHFKVVIPRQTVGSTWNLNVEEIICSSCPLGQTHFIHIRNFCRKQIFYILP